MLTAVKVKVTVVLSSKMIVIYYALTMCQASC